jgi:hypothetical protein
MKKCNVFKALGFALGACAAGAAALVIKKKLDEEKKKEAEIEAEISAILEEKFAELEACEESEIEPENEQSEEA